jgi:hypothetical protein
MRAKKAVLVFACFGAPTFGQFSYYYTDTLTSVNTSNWTQNGTLSAGSGGLTSSNSSGGSLISKISVPDGTSNYEVKTTLTLTSSGGTYVTYLRASSNAMSGPSAAGTTYSFELQNPTFSGSTCSATLAGYKIISGSVTAISSATVPCSNGMTIRAVYTNKSNQIAVFVNNLMYWWDVDSSISSGQPGIGVRGAPSGNSISEVQIATMYSGAPNGPTLSNMGLSSLPTEVDMQWHGVSEPNGPGIAFFQLLRNGSYLTNLSPTTSSYADEGLTASTTYTYSLGAYDFHFNETTIGYSETTLPSGDINPQEVGVRCLLGNDGREHRLAQR